MTKEVDMAVTTPFLLAKPDVSKTEVVKAYVYTMLFLLSITGKRQSKARKGISRRE